MASSTQHGKATRWAVGTVGTARFTGAYERYRAWQALLILVVPAVVLGGAGIAAAILMQNP
ncbi:hypothetical protein [Microbacterium terrisoli]|uniref:hypothetical protein n=1 Tax=Microbacterium terrisoli TaxID=3242192 RepID=UPI0028043EBD|nr:hypothetical protein [Microbacterium protaetiae]